jgi:hypothetical protein
MLPQFDNSEQKAAGPSAINAAAHSKTKVGVITKEAVEKRQQ